MHNVLVIAKNTFKEAVRDRIFYAILGFAVLFILLDLFLARLALGDPVMIKSFGLAGIYIFGLIVTIFLGSSIIYKEIERRTLYFIISKPVTRAQVVLGKFLGLFMAVALTTVLMAVVYIGVVLHETSMFDFLGLVAVFFQLLEMGLIVAVLIFFSSITAPMTATLLAVIMVFIGHLLGSVLYSGEIIGGTTYKLSLAFYYLFPNLEKFDLRNLVVHGISITPHGALFAIAYAVLYSGILIWGAILLLNRREL
ncbi:MAG: ABC transporter permease [Patescibacteria group bacterium]|nr:ABC transporter permease [Patescibacteria group bacterium]MDE2015315.1 ABC transporter permease [Patescibacteria group bacterium]MDE2227120.1 ABC transporter permease [Patescibacteria group bacterium]